MGCKIKRHYNKILGFNKKVILDHGITEWNVSLHFLV